MEKPKYSEDASLPPSAQKLLSAFIHRYHDSNLGMLLKGVIHNLNGSLQILSMQMELLQRMFPPGEPKLQGQMEKCLGQIDKFRGMLELLIQKSAHDEEDSPQALQLNEILEEELSLLYHDLFFKHQVKVQKELASPLPLLRGRYLDLSQGFSNLIQNALEAMEGSQQKVLTIATGVQGNFIRVSVRDTGCGVPEEMKPNLFQPFFTSKGGRHPGLGLYITRQLLSPYGATFQFSSQPGETILEVFFPLSGSSLGRA